MGMRKWMRMTRMIPFTSVRTRAIPRKIPHMPEATTRILMMIKKNKRMNKITMLRKMRSKRIPRRSLPRPSRNLTNRTLLMGNGLDPLHKTRREKMKMKKSILVESLIIISNYLVKTYLS
jgi:hypothetical protein